MLLTKSANFFKGCKLRIIFWRNVADIFFGYSIKKFSKERIAVTFRLFLLSFKGEMINAYWKFIFCQYVILDMSKVGTENRKKRFLCPFTCFGCSAFKFFIKSQLTTVFFFLAGYLKKFLGLLSLSFSTSSISRSENIMWTWGCRCPLDNASNFSWMA